MKALWMVLVAFVCHRLYFWLVAYGVGVHFNEHFPGQCKTIPGISCGSEKVIIAKRSPNQGLAFITNGFKMMTNCNPKFTQGNIYTFDFNHPDKGANKLTIHPSESLDLAAFDPHGMDLLEDGSGDIKVFFLQIHLFCLHYQFFLTYHSSSAKLQSWHLISAKSHEYDKCTAPFPHFQCCKIFED